MATKDSTVPLRDAEACIYGAFAEHGTLKGVLALLEDGSIDNRLGMLDRSGVDDGIFSRFQVIKVAFGATLEAMERDLTEALDAAQALKARRPA